MSSPHFGLGPDLRGQLLGHRYRLEKRVAWGDRPHDGIALRCGGRLVVARLKVLPEGALAVPEDEVDAFQKEGAELIEVFCAMGEE